MIPDDVAEAIEAGRAELFEADDGTLIVLTSLDEGKLARIVWAEGTRESCADAVADVVWPVARERGVDAIFAPGASWGRFLPGYDDRWEGLPNNDPDLPGAVFRGEA